MGFYILLLYTIVRAARSYATICTGFRLERFNINNNNKVSTVLCTACVCASGKVKLRRDLKFS